jgi:hypothetical protein
LDARLAQILKAEAAQKLITPSGGSSSVGMLRF